MVLSVDSSRQGLAGKVLLQKNLPVGYAYFWWDHEMLLAALAMENILQN